MHRNPGFNHFDAVAWLIYASSYYPTLIVIPMSSAKAASWSSRRENGV